MFLQNFRTSEFFNSRMDRWRSRWWHRFYLRVYLAMIASLLVTVLLIGIILHMMINSPGNFKNNMDNFSQIASDILPPLGAPAADVEIALKRWQQWMGSNLSVYDGNGKKIASAGGPMPDVFPPEMKNGWNITSPTYFATPLADGRKLLARSQSGVSVSLWQIVTPLMIAFAVALGSYPLVRRLTIRLERLNDSVSALGKGQLSTRVAVEGSDEVARLAISFNQSATRIETLVNAQKSLLANASHELRSPLTRIRMGIEMLQEQAQPGLQVELKRSINELDQLIDEILLSSRLEARHEDAFNSEAIDMLSLLSEESARVNAEISCRDITSDSAVVMGDARLLRRLLRNLLENARRHGVINGNEDISSLIYLSENTVVIEINDRGTGIPAEQRERIFEPFYRLPGAKESDGGVGLGLSLVKQIAQKHTAEITCLERESGGTCFRFSILKAS